jgi:hypothetical protein
MLNVILVLFCSFLLSCSSAKQGAYQSDKNAKQKENYLANEAEKAIEYNQMHKKSIDKKKEQYRKKEEKDLNELNHKKHSAPNQQKTEKGEFKMF